MSLTLRGIFLFEEDRRFELLKAVTPYSLSKRAH